MAVTRIRNWDRLQLYPFLESHKAAAFAWGQLDCCLFAADAVQAITGTDIADDFRGKYTDQATAFALIKRVTGGSTVADAAAWCASKHGLPELLYNGKPAPLQAHRGDLVVIDNAGQLIAGIVGIDGLSVVSMGESGIVTLPRSKSVRAWRV